jgi:hypothetical protein
MDWPEIEIGPGLWKIEVVKNLADRQPGKTQ